MEASNRKKSLAFSRFLAVCLVSSSSIVALNATAEASSSSPDSDKMHASVTQVFVNCTWETFMCASDRKCLPKTYLCDGINHCADKSDETGCSKYECDLKEFFQCDSVECYPLSWKCDGQEDCLDGTDEQNCPKRDGVVCAEGHFRCNMGLCAPEKWRCDGALDCPDGSDEQNCTKVHVANHQLFECNDPNKTTVPLRWVCDKSPDCPNGADEADCFHPVDSKKNCSLPHNDFTCDNKRECIPMANVCDQKMDCSDRSDEPLDCKRNCTTKRCEQGCVKLPSQVSETCFCESGFKLNADGLSCDDIDECANYGFCSQLCANTKGGYECSCLHGYELSPTDNATCLANSKSRPAVLFFAAKTMIGSISLGNRDARTVTQNSTFVRQAVGISYDAVDGRIFWTNLEKEKPAILSSRTDGSNFKIVMNSSLKHPEDIAIDSYTRTFYYTDSGAKIIGVCTLDGVYCHKLITDNLDQPRGIALHQEKGILFYADWGVRPHISTAGMDGSDHRMLITHNLKWPNGIVVDRTIDRIYWADAHLDRVESTRLDGTDRRIIIQLSYSHPFSVAVFENNIFWSDWSKNEILSCDKFTGAAHGNLFEGYAVQAMGIHIFHENLEPISESLCYGSPCDHICLKSPKEMGFACKCKDGYKVQNGTKCVRIEHLPKILSIPSSQTTQRPSHSGVTSSVSKTVPNGGGRGHDRSPDGEPIKERLDSHADVIVGVIFGAIALTLVVVAICCCVKKRASRKGTPACPFRLSSSSRVSFERRGGIEAGRITVDASNNEKSMNNMKTSVSNSNLDSHSRTNDFVNRSLSHPDLEYRHHVKEDRTDGDCLVDEEDDSHSWFSDRTKLMK